MQVNNINNNAFLPIAQKIRLRRVELAKRHKCPNLAEKRLKLAPPPKISTITYFAQFALFSYSPEIMRQTKMVR